MKNKSRFRRVRYDIKPSRAHTPRRSRAKSIAASCKKVTESRYALGHDNTLVYEARKSPWLDNPARIKLKGSWSLDSDHRVVCTLEKQYLKIPYVKKTFKAEIVEVSGTAITCLISTRTPGGDTSFQTIHLTGKWRTDASNRLIFDVERQREKTDSLIFKGTWYVDEQRSITYIYARASGPRKTTLQKTFTLKGYWDISRRHVLSYIIDASCGSGFHFTGTPQLCVAYGSRTGVVYELGIRTAGKTLLHRTVTIFGSLKPAGRFKLAFEIAYERGVRKTLYYTAEIVYSDSRTTRIALKNIYGEYLGIELVATKNVFKDLHVWAQARYRAPDTALQAGLSLRW